MANPSRKEMVKELVKIRSDEIYNRNIERIDQEIILLKEEMMKMSEEKLSAKEDEMWIDYLYDGQIPPFEERVEWFCCYSHDDKVNALLEDDEKYEEELDKMDNADLLVFWRTTKNNVMPPTYKCMWSCGHAKCVVPN